MNRRYAALLAGVIACNRLPEKHPNESGAPEGAPSASAPSAGRIAFAITSPRAGDTLYEGRSYVIRWMAPDTMHINLGAAMGGKDKGMLLTGASAAPDSLVWTIPMGFVTGFGVASSDQVRLRMENAASPNQWTEAGPFTITGTITRE